MVSGTFSLPRGMRDVEPAEMAKRLWVYDRIREVLRRYSFQLVDPTPIENLSTLEAKSGGEIRDQIYWFKDKSGRRLGLRFDLTVGMTRLVANRPDLPVPIKLAAIGGNWRYDEPQFARYRYFTQWDAEIFGSDDPVCDAEIISLGIDILQNIGLKDFDVRISSRKLIESFLMSIGISNVKWIGETLRVIDKFRKISREQFVRELRKLRVKPTQTEKILQMVSLNGTPDSVLASIPDGSKTGDKGAKALSELERLASYLDSFGRRSMCTYDLSVVRGIGYYDGIVFEAFDRVGEDIGSIFAGGRFDKLCQIYGKRDLPATGVAGGIERLMISLERSKVFPELRQTASVFVCYVNDQVLGNAVKICQSIRGRGIPADIDVKGRPLFKQLEFADSLKIPYVMIVGPQELGRGTVRLKTMASGQEEELRLEEALARITSQ